MSSPLLISRLVVIGAGLIGGSFALALKRAGLVGEVVGIQNNRHLATPHRWPEQESPAQTLSHPVICIADEGFQRNRGPIVRLRHGVDIWMAASLCLHARTAHVARHEAFAHRLAEQGSCQRVRKGALADARWPDKEIRPGDAAAGLRRHKPLHDRIVSLDSLPRHGVFGQEVNPVSNRCDTASRRRAAT